MTIIDATPERLSVRPVPARLLRFPLAFERAEYVQQCTCGWLSEPHESAERTAQFECPICLGKGDAALRRKTYLHLMQAYSELPESVR